MLPQSLKLVTYPNPILTSPCSEVEEIDWELERTIKLMYKVMKKKSGFAVAANQVGSPLRFFVYDLGDGPKVAINPEIEVPELEGDMNEFTYREGCLSVPNKFWAITRPDMVKVSFFDEKEKYYEYGANDIAGRVFQHEVDHLNGKMLFDAMTELQRSDALADLNGAGTTFVMERSRFAENVKG